MIERTCLVIKPDGVCQRRTGEVLRRLEMEGLTLRAIKMVRWQRPEAEAFYREHRGKPFFEKLIEFMTSAPIVASAWEGEEAVRRVRTLVGSTDARQAGAGTLRQLFGTDGRRNVVHASDSAASALSEISFFFENDEIFAYGLDDWRERPL